MKKNVLIFTLLLSIIIQARATEKLSYQAVVRNSSNALVTNTQIGMQISIRQGSPGGAVVYTETFTPTTNINGLVTVEIGGAQGFNTINWANHPYFIETQTDPTGGTDYTITGVSQLLSVPYALHAITAEKIVNSNVQKKYKLEYVSGDGQIYWGGGMPQPMVFKIFNITDNVYVTSYGEQGIISGENLLINSTANIGREDGKFDNINDYCENGSSMCYGGYYYIADNERPPMSFNLIVTVTLRYADTGEVIDRYIINQYIVRP